MKKGIAYIRVSKSRTNMITQDTQLNKIKKYCDLHDINLIDSYMDLDYSGRSTRRPDFQKLFKEIENNSLDIDYLLVYKLDRFARSVNDFHKYMEILDQQDISFVSITQQFDTSTPMGRLIRNILVDFAQFESEMVSERVKDNMINNAQNGVWNGGPVPLGFDITKEDETPNIKPNKRTKDIIKFYKWYIQPDGSIRNNVFKANEQNIPSSTGGNWNPNQMGRILKNPIYCIADKKSIKYFEEQGFEVLNKEAADGKKGFIRYNHRKPKGTTSTIRDKSKWLIAVAQHKGIVPSKLFIKTQRKRSQNAKKPARAGTGKSLLAWLVKCSKCNKAMTYSYSVSTLADGTKKRYNYYKCRSREHQGKTVCEGQSIRAERLEKAVLKTITSICQNEKFISKTKEKAKEQFEKLSNPLKQQKRQLKSKLAEIKKESENLIDTLKKGKSDKFISLIEKQIEELEEEKIQLKKKLRKINYKLNIHQNNSFNKSLVFSQLKNFEENFEEMEFEEKRNLLQSIINKIVYNEEGKAKLELFFFPPEEDCLHLHNERTRIHSSY
ncbi:MAG: resolvase domain-containing protein [Candidatus Frackibacter sp. T328-2]|nr:MAG: resolvase domain-containing protein [Candidatus Frackibacter sp. T328-2]